MQILLSPTIPINSVSVWAGCVHRFLTLFLSMLNGNPNIPNRCNAGHRFYSLSWIFQDAELAQLHTQTDVSIRVSLGEGKRATATAEREESTMMKPEMAAPFVTIESLNPFVLFVCTWLATPFHSRSRLALVTRDYSKSWRRVDSHVIGEPNPPLPTHPAYPGEPTRHRSCRVITMDCFEHFSTLNRHKPELNQRLWQLWEMQTRFKLWLLKKYCMQIPHIAILSNTCEVCQLSATRRCASSISGVWVEFLCCSA